MTWVDPLSSCWVEGLRESLKKAVPLLGGEWGPRILLFPLSLYWAAPWPWPQLFHLYNGELVLMNPDALHPWASVFSSVEWESRPGSSVSGMLSSSHPVLLLLSSAWPGGLITGPRGQVQAVWWAPELAGGDRSFICPPPWPPQSAAGRTSTSCTAQRTWTAW